MQKTGMKTVIKITLILISIIGVINIFLPNFKCEEIESNILYVGGVSDGNYSRIQDAIDNSSDGDMIFVYTGTYYENIKVNKSIILIGQNKENTIINGKNELSVVLIYAHSVNISEFTIRGGPVYGIIIESIGHCNIFQNIIENNENGIFISMSQNSKIFNNTIANCSYTGIHILNMSIMNHSFTQNNIIFHNNLINNTNSVFDNSINNWSYGGEGNYYDDYTGLDKNNDGIGDIPFDIPGGDNIDKYPLMVLYSGEITIEELSIDQETVFTMLVIGIIISIIFVLPIAYYWRKKYFL